MQPHQSGITLENIDLTLGSNASRVHVLNDISLTIASGESVGIVGPSGSGKSTLLMVLAGLEKVDSGKVLISGERIDRMSEDQAAAFRGRNIGIVFQSFHLIPNMTALENVALWHERDISHSSAERIIIADGTSLLDYMIERVDFIVVGL
ncbi:MAG: ATP-binding cassette domain-containing protein, partial [Brucellaceae bacterium]|nr:ATP-binding cassette domain-containing protein [Brucellaceae bacterium]